MFNIDVGQEINFKTGFRVFETPTDEQPIIKWISEPMTFQVEPLQNNVIYPYNIVSGEQINEGEGSNVGYTLTGSFKVTAYNFLKHLMEWELELKVPNRLTNLSFYQVYLEMSTDTNPGYYESFQLTFKY